MSRVKRFFKQNTHNAFFKALAGFGRSMNRLYENRNHDIYSNGEITILKKLAKHGISSVIDGGANVGKYAQMIAQMTHRSQIYAFEPVPDTYKKLVQNVEANPRIRTLNQGLYKSTGSEYINVFDADTHSSLYDLEGQAYATADRVQIHLIKGDDFLKNENIDSLDFLKLDIEGAEYDALLGFDESIQQHKIKVIQFEYGYINIVTKNLLIDYYKFFEERGYIVGKVFPKVVEFRDYQYKYEDFIGPNFVAVLKSEKKLIELLKNK